MDEYCADLAHFFSIQMVRWLPLESNPDVITKYVRHLGVKEPHAFTDVISVDAELLGMVPQPVLALLLLYPLTDKAQNSPLGEPKTDSDLYFAKQTIGNACGTMAVIHAVANNAKTLNLDPDKHFVKLIADTESLSPEAKSEYYEKDTVLEGAHQETAQGGQTEAPTLEEKVRHHFVVFVHKNGGLYELDGRVEGPVYHGPTSEKDFLQDAAVVIKRFMERDSGETGFSVIALSQMD